mmetsp:Transcript_559/g.770  ORF Transcript_559/g.770 Transcript_559/m.770 type:complete len:121 (+) Transcript_559:300-662(+)
MHYRQRREVLENKGILSVGGQPRKTLETGRLNIRKVSEGQGLEPHLPPLVGVVPSPPPPIGPTGEPPVTDLPLPELPGGVGRGGNCLPRPPRNSGAAEGDGSLRKSALPPACSGDSPAPV